MNKSDFFISPAMFYNDKYTDSMLAGYTLISLADVYFIRFVDEYQTVYFSSSSKADIGRWTFKDADIYQHIKLSISRDVNKIITGRL